MADSLMDANRSGHGVYSVFGWNRKVEKRSRELKIMQIYRKQPIYSDHRNEELSDTHKTNLLAES
jgi:hypothetical protein